MDNQEVWVERRDPVISLGDWIITLIDISKYSFCKFNHAPYLGLWKEYPHQQS